MPHIGPGRKQRPIDLRMSMKDLLISVTGRKEKNYSDTSRWNISPDSTIIPLFSTISRKGFYLINIISNSIIYVCIFKAFYKIFSHIEKWLVNNSLI